MLRVAGWPPDLREVSNILGRTALATPRRVLAAAILLVVSMGAATGVLVRAYHDVRARGAQEEVRRGEAAANAGRPAEAVEHYRAALALERDNGAVRRALAIALLGLRRTAEAETHLAQLRERDPIDGETNLLLARLAASRGDFVETEAAYQRAIYGRWSGPDAAARRVAARFELIEWLDQMHARTAARAELLRLQAELPDVPFLQRELAKRLLALDQPSQAADILRRELRRRPGDPRVAADLAEAEWRAGRLDAARDAARRALALDPRDRAARDRLQDVTDILTLDPMSPGLTAVDRFRRSQRLLRRVRDDLAGCAAHGSGTKGGAAKAGDMPPDVAAALATAELLLRDERSVGPRFDDGPVRSGAREAPRAGAATRGAPAPQEAPRVVARRADSAGATREATPAASLQARTDARLAVAESLWALRLAHCGPPDDGRQAGLAWIFDRLSRDAPPRTAEVPEREGAPPPR